MRAIAAEKERLDGHICAALGIEPGAVWSVQLRRAVADADYAAYDVEWRSFIPEANGPSPWREHGKRMGVAGRREKAWPWPEAEDRFLEALETQLARRPWERTAA